MNILTKITNTVYNPIGLTVSNEKRWTLYCVLSTLYSIITLSLFAYEMNEVTKKWHSNSHH